MAGTREENAFMARLAEQADRYEDMVKYMRPIVALGALSEDERNLLSVGCKSMVGARRTAWREVAAMEASLRQESELAGDLVRGYKEKVADDLIKSCTDILNLVSQEFIDQASSVQDQVFYLKMRGDYCRYMAEPQADTASHSACAGRAREAYQAATKLAEGSELEAADPLRLGLALNLSVFHHEALKQTEEACQVARRAYDEALGTVEKLPEEQREESRATLQLLRDNMQLWMYDHQAEAAAAAAALAASPGGGDGTACEDL